MELLWNGIALMAGIMFVGYFAIEYFFPVGKDDERHWRFGEYCKLHPKELNKH